MTGILCSIVGIGGAVSTNGCWLAHLHGGTDLANKIAISSIGNIYICGYSNAAAVNDIQVFKYSPEGSLVWQKRLAYASSTNDIGTGIVLDSSENIYISGYTNASATNDAVLVKLDSSGTILWQRKYGGTANEVGNGVTLDGSGNVYLVGHTSTGGTQDVSVVKYNSSGTIQWQRRVTGGSGLPSLATSVVADSLGATYAVGYSAPASGTFAGVIIKHTSAGSLSTRNTLSTTGTTTIFNDIAQDTNGNMYAVGYSTYSGSINSIILAKYNSSGTIQWQRILSGNSSIGYGVAVGSLNEIYIVGLSSPGTQACQIAKYNSSGTLQWQRVLRTNVTVFGRSIEADSQYIYLTGHITSNDIISAKLKADGSLTGTYSVGGYNFTYEASSLTAGTSTLSSNSAPTMTSATPTLTDTTSSFSSSNSGLTSSVTLI